VLKQTLDALAAASAAASDAREGSAAACAQLRSALIEARARCKLLEGRADAARFCNEALAGALAEEDARFQAALKAQNAGAAREREALLGAVAGARAELKAEGLQVVAREARRALPVKAPSRFFRHDAHSHQPSTPARARAQQ
jgi:hypothetical protein